MGWSCFQALKTNNRAIIIVEIRASSEREEEGEEKEREEKSRKKRRSREDRAFPGRAWEREKQEEEQSPGNERMRALLIAFG